MVLLEQFGGDLVHDVGALLVFLLGPICLLIFIYLFILIQKEMSVLISFVKKKRISLIIVEGRAYVGEELEGTLEHRDGLFVRVDVGITVRSYHTCT